MRGAIIQASRTAPVVMLVAVLFLTQVSVGPASKIVRSLAHGDPANADGGAWSPPQEVADLDRAVSQSEPALWVDTDGSLHAVWIDSRFGQADVLYARRPAEADEWDAPLRITSDPNAGPNSQPTVAVDSIGNVHFVWITHRPPETQLWYSMLPLHGSLASPPAPAIRVPSAAALSDPVMTADPWGTVHLVWVDHRQAVPRLYYARKPIGLAWTPGVPVQERAAAQQEPALCTTRLGDLFLVWRESGGADSAILASRLPPGGDVWWPAVELARSGGDESFRSPAVSSDSDGTVRAIWIAGRGSNSLMTAVQRSNEGVWQAATVAYLAGRQRMDRAVIAGGPGATTLAVWSEEGPAGERLMAGTWQHDRFTAARVDWWLQFAGHEDLQAVVDTLGRAHALWVGVRYDGQPRLVHVWKQLLRPSYPVVTYRGRLAYRWAEWNCRGDGYVVIDCDGSVSPLLRPAEVELLPYLGDFVVLDAAKVEDTWCVHGRIRAVARRASPCPTETGAITGVLRRLNHPVAWEEVWVGDEAVATGETGRFFASGLAAGTYVVTATHACSLEARHDRVEVHTGRTTWLEAAELVPGEVLKDCRVDVKDLVLVGAAYKSTPLTHPPCVDQNGDGAVSLADIVLVATHLGERCPTAWSVIPSMERQLTDVGMPTREKVALPLGWR